MAKRVQRRRGTTSEHTTFTGHDGETTVDTTKDTVVVHDGIVAGGYPLAREDMSNVTNKIGVTQLNLADGTADQVIKTDGSGTLSFTTINASSTSVGGDLSGTVANAQIVANSVGIAELNVSDGSADQVLKTNGSGTLSFISISTDPTMGGDLSGTASNAQIAAGAVTATEIATNGVTTAKITDLNITTAKIAADAITTAKITDLNITTGKIANDAITEAKIFAQTITNASIFPGTIRSQEIENGSIVGTDIAANSIDGTKLALGGDTLNDLMYYNGSNWVRTAGWSYDISFIAGYDAATVKSDVVVQTYAEMVMARAGIFEGEVGYIDTACTGNPVICDIFKNGSSIYSTKPQFASTLNTMTDGVRSVTTFASGDRVTFKVTQIGSGTVGKGLRFMLKCKA
jgi:hypothetical protein